MITYVVGDATRPQGDGPKIIAHVCNDVGAWGAGFVMALSDRWTAPELAYRAMSQRALGEVQFVGVERDLFVANMIAQTLGGKVPLRYEALRKCLHTVASAFRGASVHMPRIGCGLAGGTWAEVEPIIQETLCAAGVPVTVYDLPVKS